MADIKKYMKELSAAFLATEATDRKGLDLGVDGALETVINAMLEHSASGRKVIVIGNGGSSAIANHMCVDLWKNGGVRATAFSDSSLLTCIGNDYGYGCLFEKPIEMFADEGDVLLSISSSGQSENIIKGTEAGLAKGCRVFTMSGFKPANPLRKLGEANFYVPAGSYGFVEVSHQVLCHYISDLVIERNPKAPFAGAC